MDVKKENRNNMVFDIFLQIGLILVMVFMFLFMHNIPQKFFSKLRLRARSDIKAKRHFVLGAQLLARARSAKSRSNATSLANEAIAEAEKAIALDPKDAAAYLLKALALELQGFRTSALESIETALSPMAVKSLSGKEKGDALFKRAELKMAVNRRGGRVDSVIDDLNESLKLGSDNAKTFCLLGECYEVKKMKEEAKKAYEEALKVDTELVSAREGLDRLESS